MVEQWYIEPAQSELAAEGSLPFESVYYRSKDGGKETEGEAENNEMSVQIRFVLSTGSSSNTGAKTAGGGDGDNPVPPEGESDHQSAPEESAKSDQPPSSDHHQEPSH